MATPKKYKHDGKSLTLPQWSKETGLHVDCLRRRIENGWDIARALTTPSTGEKPQGAGRELKESFLSLALKAYEANKDVCFSALDSAFKSDPIKTMKELSAFIPKDAIERATTNQEKAVVRIELMPPPSQYIDADCRLLDDTKQIKGPCE